MIEFILLFTGTFMQLDGHDFYFEKECPKRIANGTCGAWYDRKNETIHIVNYTKLNPFSVKAKCNHEMYHKLEKGTAKEHHQIINKSISGLPSWVRYSTCNKLIFKRYARVSN